MKNNTKTSKIKKLLINKVTLRILLGSITLGSLSSANTTLDTKPLVELSSGIYDSIYDEQSFSFSKKIHYFDNNCNDTGLINLTDLPSVDTSINVGNLKTIKTLDIDVNNSKVSDLKHMPNIEELTLYNFKHLTNNDKNVINSLNKLKKITYKLDFDYLSIKQDIDISWIKDNVCIDISYNGLAIDSDLKDLYVYKILSKISDNYNDRINFSYFDDKRLKDLKRWDKQLADIVNSFNFDENTTDEDKIIQIVCYVTDKIDYDPYVSKILANTEGIIENEKIIESNTNLLKLVLDDNDGYGICCNYAALTNMLAYYSGIKVDYVSGVYGNNENGHAWCVYSKDNIDTIIDPTELDNNLIFNIQKTNYNTTNKYQDQKNLIYKDYMLDIIFSKDKNYKPTQVKELQKKDYNIQTDNKKENTYINTEKNRYFDEVILKEVKLKRLISLVSMLLLVSEVTISTIKRKRTKSKKLLIK